MSRKLNTTSLEHKCIPATCCCDDVCSVQALSRVCLRARISYRVGQNRTSTPYMTVYLVISLPKIPYIDTIYDRIFGEFPAKSPCKKHCIYTVYIYTIGQNRT